MSVYFDGNSDYLINTGTPPVTAYGASGFTIAAWYKRASTAVASRALVSLGQDSTADNAFSLIVGSDASVIARARDGATQNNATTSTTEDDTDWHHACGVFTSATSRAAFLDGGGKGTSTTSRTPSASTRMRVGALHDASSYMYGYIAHVAIWNIALSDGEVATLAGGALPTSVQNGNLVGYWPMLVDESPTQDTVAAYDLTFAGDATWSAETPSITSRVLKVLVASGAQSDTGIAGVVFAAPAGGDITGAKIGEFTGAAFESSLESGQAVLKVPVGDFGGEALTSSDTPVALVRNGTDTTGIVDCTVIEE